CCCLEGELERRFATAGELARQLDLCLKPRTRDLLFPKPSWRTWVRRHPLVSIYAIGLAPNILASWFSIVYNDNEIIRNVPESKALFQWLQLVVNGTFFPIGIAAVFVLLFPVVNGLRRLRSGELPAEDFDRLRRRSLFLGLGIVCVSLAAWVIAGIV